MIAEDVMPTHSLKNIVSLICVLSLILSSVIFTNAQSKQRQRRPTTSITTKDNCQKAREHVETQIATVKEQIQQDQRAIQRMNPLFANAKQQLEDWQKLSEDAQKDAAAKALKFISDLFFDGFQAGIEKGLSKTAGTVYPINVGDLVKKYNIKNQKYIDHLYELAQINIQDPLWEKKVGRVVQGIQSTFDTIDLKNKDKADWGEIITIASDVLPLFLKATVLNKHPSLKLLGLFATEFDAMLASIYDNVAERVSLSRIEAISSLAEKELEAIRALMNQLNKDIQRLKGAQETLAALNCNAAIADLQWEVELQQARLEIVQNVSAYNWLLGLHAEIYKHRNKNPIDSGFYPGGVYQPSSPSSNSQNKNISPASPDDSANPKVQIPQSSNACPPVSPRNAIDALRIEGASHKNVCWQYVAQKNEKGETSYVLMATAANPPDKNYKPPILGNVTKSASSSIGKADESNRGIKLAASSSISDKKTLPVASSASLSNFPAASLMKIEYTTVTDSGVDSPVTEYKEGGTDIVYRSANGWYPKLYDLSGKLIKDTHSFINPGNEYRAYIDEKPGEYLIETCYLGEERYKVTVVQGQVVYFTEPRKSRIVIHWPGKNARTIFRIFDSKNKLVYREELPTSVFNGTTFVGLNGDASTPCAAPGIYTLKIQSWDDYDIGYSPIQFSVRKGQDTHITLSTGTVRLVSTPNEDWQWEIYDVSGARLLVKADGWSDGFFIYDLAPGEYVVKNPLKKFVGKVGVHENETVDVIIPTNTPKTRKR
jgi:hypothetical protein